MPTVFKLLLQGGVVMLLRHLRFQKSLSQAEIGMVLGISQPRYSLIERGKVPPTPEETRKLEQFFGHQIQALLEEARFMSKSAEEVLALLDCGVSIADLVAWNKEMQKAGHLQSDDNELLATLYQARVKIKRELLRRAKL